ncbi:MAG: hypothetical protein ABIF82_13010 [Planctomycetota bacterium]
MRRTHSVTHANLDTERKSAVGPTPFEASVLRMLQTKYDQEEDRVFGKKFLPGR